MAGEWQDHGRSKSKAIAWQEHGRRMAGAWHERGKSMSGAWNEHGRSMARAWHEGGRRMAGWPEPGPPVGGVELGPGASRETAQGNTETE